MTFQCAFCRAAMPTLTARMNHEESCQVFSTEKLCWYECKNRLPDDQTSVLLFGPGSDPTCEGFIEAGSWYLASGVLIEGEITHWAEMPLGPTA